MSVLLHDLFQSCSVRLSMPIVCCAADHSFRKIMMRHAYMYHIYDRYHLQSAVMHTNAFPHNRNTIEIK